jgi:hypothetical protein
VLQNAHPSNPPDVNKVARKAIVVITVNKYRPKK